MTMSQEIATLAIPLRNIMISTFLDLRVRASRSLLCEGADILRSIYSDQLNLSNVQKSSLKLAHRQYAGRSK
jgi:hypothetical protein